MNLFDQVAAILGGEPNRRGWRDAVCPACGKAPGQGQVHFGYRETGGHCFVCGWSGGLRVLADLLALDGDYTPTPKEPEPPKPPARWRLNPDRLLAQHQNHPQRLAAWRRYKPLRAETIERHGFGFGRLPFLDESEHWYMSKAEWLTVPVYANGRLSALRGRNQTQRGAKWISATGSEYALWGVENVRLGHTVWLCENYVDAAWLMQEHPEWRAVAIGGATTWQRPWAHQLATRRPAQVIVALDNDLPGNGGGEKREQWMAEWKAAHPQPGLKPPAANGPRIVDDLQLSGVPAELFVWPDNAPHKAGIDWVLIQRGTEK